MQSFESNSPRQTQKSLHLEFKYFFLFLFLFLFLFFNVHKTNFDFPKGGSLFLVDLAGSERASDRQEHTAERLEESKLINTSLMTLKDCIKARSVAGSTNGKHLHIPYRASRLTLILRDCFELAVKKFIFSKQHNLTQHNHNAGQQSWE